MKLLCIIAAAMALVLASSTAMAAPKKHKATHRMNSPSSVPASRRQWPPNNPTPVNTRNLNAKVGTKEIVRDQDRDAGSPWQEVVSLQRPGQAVIQAVAEDANGAGLACLEK